MSGTRVVLVRHGESNATVQRFVGGPRSCTGLTDLGRRQAELLRDRLLTGHDITATGLYSSNYPRAMETARIIAPALGSLPLVTDPDWGEHDPGPQCDGLTYQEYVERFGRPNFEGTASTEVYPGGETLGQFRDRVVNALERVVIENQGGTAVVACHAWVIDAVLRHVVRAPIAGVFELATRNTSLTEVLHVQGSKWRLVRYNDAAHLNGA